MEVPPWNFNHQNGNYNNHYAFNNTIYPSTRQYAGRQISPIATSQAQPYHLRNQHPYENFNINCGNPNFDPNFILNGTNPPLARIPGGFSEIGNNPNMAYSTPPYYTNTECYQNSSNYRNSRDVSYTPNVTAIPNKSTMTSHGPLRSPLGHFRNPIRIFPQQQRGKFQGMEILEIGATRPNGPKRISPVEVCITPRGYLNEQDGTSNFSYQTNCLKDNSKIIGDGSSLSDNVAMRSGKNVSMPHDLNLLQNTALSKSFYGTHISESGRTMNSNHYPQNRAEYNVQVPPNFVDNKPNVYQKEMQTGDIGAPNPLAKSDGLVNSHRSGESGMPAQNEVELPKLYKLLPSYPIIPPHHLPTNPFSPREKDRTNPFDPSSAASKGSSIALSANRSKIYSGVSNDKVNLENPYSPTKAFHNGVQPSAQRMQRMVSPRILQNCVQDSVAAMQNAEKHRYFSDGGGNILGPTANNLPPFSNAENRMYGRHPGYSQQLLDNTHLNSLQHSQAAYYHGSPLSFQPHRHHQYPPQGTQNPYQQKFHDQLYRDPYDQATTKTPFMQRSPNQHRRTNQQNVRDPSPHEQVSVAEGELPPATTSFLGNGQNSIWQRAASCCKQPEKKMGENMISHPQNQKSFLNSCLPGLSSTLDESALCKRLNNQRRQMALRNQNRSVSPVRRGPESVNVNSPCCTALMNNCGNRQLRNDPEYYHINQKTRRYDASQLSPHTRPHALHKTYGGGSTSRMPHRICSDRTNRNFQSQGIYPINYAGGRNQSSLTSNLDSSRVTANLKARGPSTLITDRAVEESSQARHAVDIKGRLKKDIDNSFNYSNHAIDNRERILNRSAVPMAEDEVQDVFLNLRLLSQGTFRINPRNIIFDTIKQKDNTIDYTLIEEGSFGRVYLGKMTNGLTVAIKVPLPKMVESDPIGILDRIAAEWKFLQILNHTNIVQFVGCAVVGTYEIWVVTRFVDGHDLHTIKYSPLPRIRREIPPSAAVDMCRQLAQVVSYLHKTIPGEKPKIVHRDIKPENVIIDKNWHISLCDFGDSEESIDGSVRNISGATWFYAPIELLKADPLNKSKAQHEQIVLTEKWDIWSMGCVFHEFFGLPNPFHRFIKHDDPLNTVYEKLVRVARNGELTPDISPTIPIPIRDIISSCLNSNPTLRPNADEVLDMWLQNEKEIVDAIAAQENCTPQANSPTPENITTVTSD